MDYRIAQQEGFVEVATGGVATVETFMRMLSDILGLDGWTPGTPLLMNHTELNTESLTTADIREIARITFEAKSQFGSLRMATLVRRDIEFGLARMWEVFIDERWDGESQVFRDRGDAEKWLLES